MITELKLAVFDNLLLFGGLSSEHLTCSMKSCVAEFEVEKEGW